MKERYRTALAGLLAALFCCQGALATSEKLATAYYSGEETLPYIAITVDDCYDMQIVTDMLDLFARENIKVTFYPIGANIKPEDGDIWRRMVDEGHEIGNHTQGHVQLNKPTSTAKSVLWQLKTMEESLAGALGYEYNVRTIRPPFGRYTLHNTMGRIKQAGYDHIVLWSVSQIDPVEAMKTIKNGSICLFHARSKDLRCLEEIIPQLKEQGFEMVTISELLELDGVTLAGPAVAATTEPPTPTATATAAEVTKALAEPRISPIPAGTASRKPNTTATPTAKPVATPTPVPTQGARPAEDSTKVKPSQDGKKEGSLPVPFFVVGSP